MWREIFLQCFAFIRKSLPVREGFSKVRLSHSSEHSSSFVSVLRKFECRHDALYRVSFCLSRIRSCPPSCPALHAKPRRGSAARPSLRKDPRLQKRPSGRKNKSIYPHHPISVITLITEDNLSLRKIQIASWTFCLRNDAGLERSLLSRTYRVNGIALESRLSFLSYRELSQCTYLRTSTLYITAIPFQFLHIVV